MSRKRKRKRGPPPAIRRATIEILDGERRANARTHKILADLCGELMTCLICGRMDQSDARTPNNWRAITADGVTYYFCPEEFPPDPGTCELFEAAYNRCMLAVLFRRQDMALTDPVFRPIDWTTRG